MMYSCNDQKERKPQLIYWVCKKSVGVTTFDCSILDVSVTNSAQYEKPVPNMLGHGALKVCSVDECSLLVVKINLDFKDQYSSKYNNYHGKVNDEWLEHVDMKELFGGIVKLFTKLSPGFSRGDWMGGVPIFYEGAFYSMKYDGYEVYLRDIKNLHKMIENVIMGLAPEAVDVLDDSHNESVVERSRERQYLQRFYNRSRLTEFKDFVLDLKDFDKRKMTVPLCRPFFWTQKERFYFMEKVYDIFWVEKNLFLADVKKVLEKCFPVEWLWLELVPVDGPLRRVFEFNPNPKIVTSQVSQYRKQGESQGQYKKSVDSIAFWRNSRCHHNDHRDQFEGPKTVEEIEAELNEKLDICRHVFIAICNFINQAPFHSIDGTPQKRLIALGEEMGFLAINANASTASTSTPNSNTS